MADVEELSRVVVDAGFKLHADLGPGLLESVYEAILEAKLAKLGLSVRRQVPINIEYDGLRFDNAFRADLLVEDTLLLEIKSIDWLSPVHAKQVLTYLRLMKLPLGLLINFGGATFREGVKRLVNGHDPLASSRLRANQPSSGSNRS